MLKEYQYVFHRVNMALDLLLTSAAVVLAHLLRNHVLAPYVLPDIFRRPSSLSDYSWLLWVMPILVVFFQGYNGYYESQRIRSVGHTIRTALLSTIEATIATAVISFALSSRAGEKAGLGAVENVSRGVLFLVPLIATVLILGKTYFVRRILTELRRRGKNWRSLLLVGSGENLRDFIRLITSHPLWGFKIVGVIDDGGREALKVEDIPVVGSLRDLWEFLDHNPVDEVVFVPAARSLEELTPYLEGCEEMGLRTRVPLNFFRHTIARPVIDSFEDIPVVTYSPTHSLNLALLFKYAFDRVAALFLILLLSPLFVITALLIKLTGWRDPIFYGQIRSGLNGKPFTLWKFRSMKMHADAELEKLREMNEMQGPVFKIKNDPRITAVGRWIRKTSIDELPQLYNVLRGDMSLVGPRPPLPAEVKQYDRWQRRRLSMKPGITCLWQVMGRNRLPFDTWMKLDLQYIDNWSLMLDFKILLRTIYVVATGYGAM